MKFVAKRPYAEPESRGAPSARYRARLDRGLPHAYSGRMNSAFTIGGGSLDEYSASRAYAVAQDWFRIDRSGTRGCCRAVQRSDGTRRWRLSPIAYRIVQSIGPNNWVWTVAFPNTAAKSGKGFSRVDAEQQALRAIDKAAVPKIRRLIPRGK